MRSRRRSSFSPAIRGDEVDEDVEKVLGRRVILAWLEVEGARLEELFPKLQL